MSCHSLSSSTSDNGSLELMDLANAGAVECGSAMFMQHELRVAQGAGGGGSSSTSSRRLTFEAFASWYTNGGYDQAAWLELLDPKKWPSQ